MFRLLTLLKSASQHLQREAWGLSHGKVHNSAPCLGEAHSCYAQEQNTHSRFEVPHWQCVSSQANLPIKAAAENAKTHESGEDSKVSLVTSTCTLLLGSSWLTAVVTSVSVGTSCRPSRSKVTLGLSKQPIGVPSEGCLH